ncbi:tyrosine-type recombinase/integrase [Candidatus Omnitrophota bacterium]
MKKEPLHKVQNIQWVMDERKCLNTIEIQKLRKSCAMAKAHGLRCDKFTPVRNWFMIELGLNAGLRVEEMASLKHSNLIIESDRSSIVVIGKGNKKRAVWINADFKRKCQMYHDYKERLGYSLDDDSFLLNNLKGGKISKRALQKFFKIIMGRAGLPAHFHIHCLRHTYTTFLLTASNFNYRFVQKQLGHSSIKTTQVYAGVLESEGKKAVEKLYH